MSAVLRVGIVGAGAIAPAHARGWRDLGAEVINYSLSGAPELCAQYGLTVADSFDQLLDAVDIVDVCTPTLTHPELVIAAAQAGKDVVCEKPLALTTARARDMIEACRAAGVHLFPAHVVRFTDAYEATHDYVAGGAFGPVAVQRFLRSGGRPGPERGWFADPAQSGGLIFDLMIHDIDIARWMAGDVVRVFARDSATIDNPDAAVVAHVIMTHTSGAISQCTASWRAGAEFETRFFISGPGGILSHELGGHVPFRLQAAPVDVGQPSYVPDGGVAASPYTAELREFLAVLHGEAEPRLTADDGLAAIAIVEAAVESTRTGAAVDVEVAA